MVLRRFFLLAALAFIGACSGIQLEPQPPPGFDLTGRWLLQDQASDTAPSTRRLRARGGMLSFVAQDFPVLKARVMEIEQHRDSMGISYDVGDYRDISWGARQRGLWEVRAGWSDGLLYILSDASDARAREVLRLSDDGRVLEIEVRIDSGGEELDLIRSFRRER
jgi:hypothetical protein